jgi:hypothetical protein
MAKARQLILSHENRLGMPARIAQALGNVEVNIIASV